jgi:hypothetical protein
LDNVQDGIKTLRHETLGHFGLNLLTPDDKLAEAGLILALFVAGIAENSYNTSLFLW